MTPVGHCLIGASIALFAIPQGSSPKRRILTISAFLFLANVPDIKLPGWGHDRYDISHSIFSIGTMGAILVALTLFSPAIRRRIGGLQVSLLGALAMLSHLLLDSMYNHGKGIAIFWPVSDARLNLALPWFATLKTSLPAITAHSVRVMAIELVFYGVIFFLAWNLTRRRGWNSDSPSPSNPQ